MDLPFCQGFIEQIVCHCSHQVQVVQHTFRTFALKNNKNKNKLYNLIHASDSIMFIPPNPQCCATHAIF